jgi:hypothetical protein
MRVLRYSTAVAVLMACSPAFAQSPAGNPSDPTTTQNQQPGPSVPRPTDPATADDPAARVPTAPVDTTVPSGDGVGTGEGGLDVQPGDAAVPSTDTNLQPGPSDVGAPNVSPPNQ